MADEPVRGPVAGPAHGVPEPGGASPRAPRWFKVFLVGAVVVVALLAIMLVVGGGDHGPGRHTGGDPPPGVDDHVPPAGVHGR